MPSNYPVGSAWEYVSPHGDTGTVWLAEKREGYGERWLWTFRHKDGSGTKGDHITRQGAIAGCKMEFFNIRTGKYPGRVVFKRREPVLEQQ